MLVPCYFCLQSTCSICGSLGEKRFKKTHKTSNISPKYVDLHPIPSHVLPPFK